MVGVSVEKWERGEGTGTELGPGLGLDKRVEVIRKCFWDLGNVKEEKRKWE